jgi:hypothetical protein
VLIPVFALGRAQVGLVPSSEIHPKLAPPSRYLRQVDGGSFHLYVSFSVTRHMYHIKHRFPFYFSILLS